VAFAKELCISIQALAMQVHHTCVTKVSTATSRNSPSYCCRGCLHQLLLDIQNQTNFVPNKQEILQAAQRTTGFCLTNVTYPVHPQLAFDKKIFRNRQVCGHCIMSKKRKAEDENPNSTKSSRGKTLSFDSSKDCAVNSLSAAASQALQKTAVIASTSSGNSHKQHESDFLDHQAVCAEFSARSSGVNTQTGVKLCIEMEADNTCQEQYTAYKYDVAEFFEAGISSSTTEHFEDFLCLRLHSKNEHAITKNYAAFSVAYLQLHVRGLFAQLQTCCIMLDEIEAYMKNLKVVYDLHRSIQSSKIDSSKLHCFFFKNMRTYPLCCSLHQEFQDKLEFYSVPHTFYDSNWNVVEMAATAKFVRLPLNFIWNFSSYRRKENKSNFDKSASCCLQDIVGFELVEMDKTDDAEYSDEGNGDKFSCTWQKEIMLNDMVFFDGNRRGLQYGREEHLEQMQISFSGLGVKSNFEQKYKYITRKLQCSHKQELHLENQKIAELRCLRNDFELDLKMFKENNNFASKLHKIDQITDPSKFLEILALATDVCKILRQELITLHKKYACRFDKHLQDGNLNNAKFWKKNTTRFENLYKFGAWSDKCANFCVGTLHEIIFKLYDNVSLSAQYHCIDSYMILIPQAIITNHLILGTQQNRDFFVLQIANLKLFMQSRFFITSEHWNLFEQNLQFLNHIFFSISSQSEDIYALQLPMCLFLMTADFFNNAAWKMLCFGKLRLCFGLTLNIGDKRNDPPVCNYDFCQAGNLIHTHQYASSSYYL
jgi:hypothetical protein